MFNNVSLITPRYKIFIFALLLWGITSFFYFFQFILRVSPASCADLIMLRHGISAVEFGQIIGLYYLGYALLQIPAGVILDRFGVRMPGTWAMITCSIGMYLFAYSSNIHVIAMARLMMGAGSAFAFLSNIKIASQLFSSQRLPIFIGLTLMIGTIGAIFAGAPLTYCINKFGPQDCLYAISFIGGIHAVLFFLVIPSQNSVVMHRPQYLKNGTSDCSKRPLIDVFNDMKRNVMCIVRNPTTFILGFYGLLMYLPLSGFSELWGPLFFEDTKGLTQTEATAVTSLTFLGMGIGAPLWSYIHTKTRHYYREMMVSTLLTLLIFSLIFFLQFNNYILLAFTLFSAGLSLSGQFLAFSCVAEQYDSNKTASASGIHNMMCMTSGMVAQPLIGYFIERGGRIYHPNKVIYNLDGYIQGFSIILMCLFISFLVLVMFRRRIISQ